VHTHYKEGLVILAVMQAPWIMRCSFLEISSSCGDSSASSAGVVGILQHELDNGSNVFLLALVAEPGGGGAWASGGLA